MYRSLLTKNASHHARGASAILLRQGRHQLPRAISASLSSGCRARFQSTAASYPPYEKPPNVEQWERLAEKELSRSTKSVDSLRTNRVTPVRYCALQVTLLFFLNSRMD